MNAWMFWLVNVCPKQALLPGDQKYMMGCLTLEFKYRSVFTFINFTILHTSPEDVVTTFWLFITKSEKIFKNETSYFHDKIHDVHLENW